MLLFQARPLPELVMSDFTITMQRQDEPCQASIMFIRCKKIQEEEEFVLQIR